MENNEIDLVKMDILKMARDLAINEFTDIRADLHNQWLVESERVWNNQRTKLPYPSIPRYPSETDIITRAKSLMEFLKKDTPQKPPVKNALQILPKSE